MTYQEKIIIKELFRDRKWFHEHKLLDKNI